MEFENLAEVLRHQFVGNYRDDADAFSAIDRFCETSSNLDDIIRASEHASNSGMGETLYPITEEELTYFRERYPNARFNN